MIRWGRLKRKNWDRRSRQEQLEVSTRWVLYSSPWIFYASGMAQLATAVSDEPLSVTLTVAVFALGLIQCALSVGALRQGMDHYLGDGPAPTARLRILATVAALSIAVLVTLVALGLVSEVRVPAMVLFATLPGVANVYGLVVTARRAMVTVTCAVFGVTVLFALSGMGLRNLVGTFIVAVILGYIGVIAPRSSCWYLVVMRELDGAKQAHTRLAVAEERLRFSRDLHDVVGRNLSVIALKSELAAQLARRGPGTSEAAVEQMTEVQRIARESQTEVRDVVRGYREVSLHTELAGARGVLRAAGVDCRIEERGDELPDSVQAALGWVVREGATNVLRHADATRCLIQVGEEDGGATAVLLMENDGVHAHVPHTESGSGLTGLRERLTAVGGTLSVERDEKARTFRLRAEVALTGQDAGVDGSAGGGAKTGGGGGTGESVERRTTWGRWPGRRDGVGGADGGEGAKGSSAADGGDRASTADRGDRGCGYGGADEPDGESDSGTPVSGEPVSGRLSGSHPRTAG